MENKAYKEIMATLSETYTKNVTPLMAKVYWQAFKPYSDHQVQKAVIDYISDPDVCQFWPQAGSIIAKITGNSKQVDLSITDAAMKAWEQVLVQIRKSGAYGKLQLEDKLAMKAVISIGGWRELCHTEESALTTWKRKEFIEAYKSFQGASNLPEFLAGIGVRKQGCIGANDLLEKIKEKR